MTIDFNMNGRRMHVRSTDRYGEANTDTIFDFEQTGHIVTARYSGGRILIGYLIGTIREAALEFRFVQANTSNNLDSGNSTCEIKRLANGRLELIEHFKWSTREGTGTNVYEETEV